SLSALIATLDQLFIHTAYCIAQPTTAPECGNFWSWAIVGCFTLGSLAMVFLVWKGTSYSIQFYAAQLVPLEPGRTLVEDPLGHLRRAGSPAPGSSAAEDE